jgi:hypothetical protein
MNHTSGTEWTQNDEGIWEATLPDGALAHVWRDGRWFFEVFLTCGLNLLEASGYMRADVAQTSAVNVWEIWKKGEKSS